MFSVYLVGLIFLAGIGLGFQLGLALGRSFNEQGGTK